MRSAAHGWGRTNSGVTDLVEIDSMLLAERLGSLDERGAIVRGRGRSYGDAAMNSGGSTVRLTDATSPGPATAFSAGAVRASAALSFDRLLANSVPNGYFVPVSPGTRSITVGGAIACDVHGKNHHRDGSFGDHVHSLRLLLASGETVEASRTNRAELFWATVGGMGLTGAILDATISLIPIETSAMLVSTRRCDDFDRVVESLDHADRSSRYSVAWLDLTPKRRGRGIVMTGDHAPLDALNTADDPLAFAPRSFRMPLAARSPVRLVRPTTVRAFNELWFRRAPRRRDDEIQPIAAFFHPLDAVENWNRIYGHRGVVQYQFVVPEDRIDVVRTVAKQIADRDLPSFLTVLKRFGTGNEAPLSFPTAGWTLAVDIPAAADGIAAALAAFDRLVLDAGGRHYLAKDHHLSPNAVQRGYPRLDEWRATRQRFDPQRRWQSDLSRRLELDTATPARPQEAPR